MSKLDEFIAGRVQELTAPTEPEPYSGRVTVRLRAAQVKKLEFLSERLKSTKSGMGERLLTAAIDDAFEQAVRMLEIDDVELQLFWQEVAAAEHDAELDADAEAMLERVERRVGRIA